jgi:hypothetical protein
MRGTHYTGCIISPQEKILIHRMFFIFCIVIFHFHFQPISIGVDLQGNYLHLLLICFRSFCGQSFFTCRVSNFRQKNYSLGIPPLSPIDNDTEFRDVLYNTLGVLVPRNETKEMCLVFLENSNVHLPAPQASISF